MASEMILKQIFMQDGAPAHYARRVRDFFDEGFLVGGLGGVGPLVGTVVRFELSRVLISGFIQRHCSCNEISDTSSSQGSNSCCYAEFAYVVKLTCLPIDRCSPCIT